MASIDSSFAESIKAQVFTTRTSASSGCDVISIPRSNTLPSMISASTRFLAQPRLIIPTFVRADWRAGVLFKGNIGVVRREGRSIFRDLHRIALQHFYRHVPTLKGRRRIRRIDPAIEDRFGPAVHR